MTYNYGQPGGTYALQIVRNGKSAIQPDVPTKTDYTFAGWELDGKAYDFTASVTENITKTRNVLSSILRMATEWEIIDRNPCDKVRVQAESTADKLKFFTPEQAAAFLQYIEQPYTVRVGGHTRIDDTGTPYTVGDYEITKNIQEQIKLLFNLAIYTGL